jgi:glycosyltransferase involved in cell wall biosynthesis
MKNDKEAFLTIVVPVYNSAKYVGATLKSIVDVLGNMRDVEVIIQNSCSTDGSTKIITEFIQKYDFFQHFIEKDDGQSDGINRAASRSRSEWITWLCADDLLLQSFSRILESLRTQSGDVVYGDCIMMLGNGALVPAIGTEMYRQGILSKKRMILPQPGTCIRKRLWDEVGGVDLSLNWTMDYDFFLKLETLEARFLRVDEFVAVARIYQEAKTSSGSIKRLFEHWGIISRAHFRRISYFSFIPYVLYTTEYVIKKMESKNIKFCLGKLHKLFWKIGSAKEKEVILARFENRRNEIEHEIRAVNKGCLV